MSRTARLALLMLAGLLIGAALVLAARLDDDPAPPPTTDPTPSSPAPTSTSTPPVEPSPTTAAPTAETPTPVLCPPGPTRRLTVLTFNIHGGLGHSGSGLDRIADEIESWDADVVLLQEVDRYRERTGLVDQSRTLATRLGMVAAYGANVVRDPVQADGRQQEYGTLTLSRLPVLESDNVRLPNRPGLERRGLLRTTVDLAGVPVDVYNTHLQHTSGVVRRAQVRAIKDELRERALPTLLGGDFNAEPDSRALSLLTGWRFADPWPVAGGGQGLTVPAGEPRRRIDFVLHDASFVPRAADDLVSAVSDHRAVRVRLALTGSPGCVTATDGSG
jgi:endonuclease/exonuclease/phosphatase family metal-dependent hydrolase